MFKLRNKEIEHENIEKKSSVDEKAGIENFLSLVAEVAKKVGEFEVVRDTIVIKRNRVVVLICYNLLNNDYYVAAFDDVYYEAIKRDIGERQLASTVVLSAYEDNKIGVRKFCGKNYLCPLIGVTPCAKLEEVMCVIENPFEKDIFRW